LDLRNPNDGRRGRGRKPRLQRRAIIPFPLFGRWQTGRKSAPYRVPYDGCGVSDPGLPAK